MIMVFAFETKKKHYKNFKLKEIELGKISEFTVNLRVRPIGTPSQAERLERASSPRPQSDLPKLSHEVAHQDLRDLLVFSCQLEAL